MAEETTGTVVVALPAAADPVNGIGDGQKHATLVFLGDDLDDTAVDAVREAVAAYVAAGVADGTLGPFPEHVTGVESLGDQGARVWMIASDDGLIVIHDDLAALPAIAEPMAAAEQFPTYTPHMTIGYPPEGSTELDEATETAAADVESISFDRIAVWSGTAQTEFPLTDGGPEMTAPVVERDFTAKQRKSMAGKGTAMSDGSYPIGNTSDLANAVQAYGRAKNKAAVKRHIIKRARALGAVSSLPDDWNVSESAPLLHETVTLSERATQGTGGRWVVSAISAGVGSSGYYSPDVLERAATNQLIGAGTPLFFDHASESERTDRPERSVRDIAAVFTAPAVYDKATQALVGEVQVFGPYRELVQEMAPHIGLSISGSATDITEGTVDGRRVKVVEDLFAISSVDLVTKAGRGGAFMSLLESARAEVDRQAEDAGAGVEEASYGAMQTALCDAVKAEYGGEKTYAWVRDFDDDTVWFEVSTSDSEAMYGQGYTFDAASGQASLTGTRTEVRAVTNYVPATRPDGNNTTESHEENKMGTKQIEESEYTRLTEQAGRVDTLEAENKTLTEDLTKVQTELTEAKASIRPSFKAVQDELAESRRENATLRAKFTAGEVITGLLTEALVSEGQKATITRELLEAVTVTDKGDLDVAALTKLGEAKIRTAEDVGAEYLKAMHVGEPRGLGQFTAPMFGEQVAEHEKSIESGLSSIFGLSEAAAKTAVKGR